MWSFGRCHHRLIVILIRYDDSIVPAGATITLSARVVHLAPFVEVVRTTTCQGNAHQRYPLLRPLSNKHGKRFCIFLGGFLKYDKQNSEDHFRLAKMITDSH
jgi:hypothetical protein